MNDSIEQLAAQKPFDALSAAERALVLAEMSRESYEQIRVIILAAPALDAGLEPPLALRGKLLARMTAGAPARPPLWARPVPVWQAAAVLLVALAMVGLWKKETVREVSVPFVQVRVDTVFVPKIEWKERVVVREKLIYREKTPAAPIAVVPKSTGTPLSETPEFPGYDMPAAPVGTSLGNEPGLLDFFVEIK